MQFQQNKGAQQTVFTSQTLHLQSSTNIFCCCWRGWWCDERGCVLLMPSIHKHAFSWQPGLYHLQPSSIFFPGHTLTQTSWMDANYIRFKRFSSQPNKEKCCWHSSVRPPKTGNSSIELCCWHVAPLCSKFLLLKNDAGIQCRPSIPKQGFCLLPFANCPGFFVHAVAPVWIPSYFVGLKDWMTAASIR